MDWRKLLEKEERIPFLYKDHPAPATRREFLKSGILGFSAMTTVPGLFGLASGRTLFANTDCLPAMAYEYTPFLVIDCAGGAALPGNFLVGKQGGPEDLLPSYDRIGWNPLEAGALDKQFGLPMSAKNSRMLTGIVQTATPAARANLRMGSFCHFADFDTQKNPLSAITLMLKGGYKGKTLSRALGTINSDSGGNSQAALSDPAMKPVRVASVVDVMNAISFTNAEPFKALGKEGIRAVLEANAALNHEVMKSFDKSEATELLRKNTECAAKENIKLLETTVAVDPRTVPIFQQLYGINANSNPTQINSVFASVVMNTLMSNTGPGSLTIGGCDYHTGNSQAGDQKDQEIGNAIGRAVEAAHRLQKPFFFQLITDGGCSNKQGTRDWTSDSGDKCMTVIGYYDPKGPRKQRRLQVGSFTEGQGADRGTLIGDSPFKVACAVYANYLRLHVTPDKFEAEFHKVVPRGVFNSLADIESLLIFEDA